MDGEATSAGTAPTSKRLCPEYADGVILVLALVRVLAKVLKLLDLGSYAEVVATHGVCDRLRKSMARLNNCMYLFPIVLFVTLSPASGAAPPAESALAIMTSAHSGRPNWVVKGGMYITLDMLDEFPQETRDWYDRFEGSDRIEGPDGRPFVLNSLRRWYGNSDGFLRSEWKSIFSGGDSSRSTRVEIWTDTEHLVGSGARSLPDEATRFHPLTLDEEQEVWEKGRMPFSRMRANQGGYIELSRYALRLLAQTDDLVSGVSEDGSIFCYSDYWRIYVNGDSETGEISTIVLGLTKTSSTLSRHEYHGRLSANLFPARYPRQEIHFHFKTSPQLSRLWEPSERPQINGLIAFSDAQTTNVSSKLFEWNDPDFDRSKVPNASALNAKRETISKAKPVFVPSKTNPGRVVPNTPKSRMKTILLASGIALLVGGGILAIRRRAG